MSYKTEKLNLQVQSIAGRRLWNYDDTGALPANVVAAGYFSDGKSKGMKAGDGIKFTTGAQNFEGYVSAIQAEDTGLPSATVVLDTD